MIVRRAFGVAAGGHQNPGRHNFRYAWPSAQWGSLPIEGGLEVAYRAEIESAADPAAKHAEIEARVAAHERGESQLVDATDVLAEARRLSR